MESCFIPIKLETKNDVYFGITNTILSYDKKKKFTKRDIVKELKRLGWDERIFKKWPINRMINTCIENLIDHSKLYEEPRCYILRDR